MGLSRVSVNLNYELQQRTFSAIAVKALLFRLLMVLLWWQYLRYHFDKFIIKLKTTLATSFGFNNFSYYGAKTLTTFLIFNNIVFALNLSVYSVSKTVIVVHIRYPMIPVFVDTKIITTKFLAGKTKLIRDPELETLGTKQCH